MSPANLFSQNPCPCVSSFHTDTVPGHSVVSNSLSPPGSSVNGDSPGQNTGVGCHAPLQGNFPTQGSNPGLPHCRRVLYQLSHKPKDTGVGSLYLLQWIFPTQESNWGLLHCRWILYQLSYQGVGRAGPWFLKGN